MIGNPSVHPNIFPTHPTLTLYSFQAQEYRASRKENIIAELANEISALSLKWPDPISALPLISEWREIYRTMGLKPTKTTSSVESLIRRARSNKWHTGAAYTDFYNGHSIAHAAPIGGYDVAKLHTSLTLRFGDPKTDHYVPLSGSPEDFPIHSKLMLYASGNDVVCWGLNHRDSAKFCLDSNTREALFVSEGITPSQINAAAAAMASMRAALLRLGHDCSDMAVADRANPQGVYRL